jgi:hypothetical protein
VAGDTLNKASTDEFNSSLLVCLGVESGGS